MKNTCRIKNFLDPGKFPEKFPGKQFFRIDFLISNQCGKLPNCTILFILFGKKTILFSLVLFFLDIFVSKKSCRIAQIPALTFKYKRFKRCPLRSLLQKSCKDEIHFGRRLGCGRSGQCKTFYYRVLC